MFILLIAADVISEDTIEIIHYVKRQETTYMSLEPSAYK